MSNMSKLEELIDVLHAHGLRVTEQRKMILELVLNAKQPISAMEIYEQMEQHFHGLSYGTVYLNIKRFKQIGIMESVVIHREFRYRMAMHEKPTYRLICVSCDQTIRVGVSEQQLGLPDPGEFVPLDYKLDVFGYCSTCHTKDEGENRGNDFI